MARPVDNTVVSELRERISVLKAKAAAGDRSCHLAKLMLSGFL